jgi:uncharacterized membrane protein
VFSKAGPATVSTAPPSAPSSQPSRPPGSRRPSSGPPSGPPSRRLSLRAPEPPEDRAFHPLDIRRARNRLGTAIGVGLLAYAALAIFASGAGWAVRVLTSWNASAVLLLLLAWSIIWDCDPARTRRRAATEDPGRSAVWAIVLGASTLSLFASAYVLRQARLLAPAHEAALVVLSLAAVVSSWCLTHTAYTLRYAHLYYRDDDGGEGGLTFPGAQAPDYYDFAYFAFTVGMCFQVSDVSITSKHIRRAVLGHSVLSFAYNTAILALALNLVAGLLG